MFFLHHSRVKLLFIFIFSVMLTTTVQAIFFVSIGSGSNFGNFYNNNQNHSDSKLKTAVYCLNSVNGVIFIGSGLLGYKAVFPHLASVVFDPLITEASKRIDAKENPKSGLAMGISNVAVATLYGLMIQSAGLLDPMNFTLTGALWAAKGVKCLLTAACQFALAGQALRNSK